MADKKDEAEYSKSTEQEYKESLRQTDEERAKAEKDNPGRDMTVEGNDRSAYVGVDPVYQNYANEGEKPYTPEDGSADAAIVEEFNAAQTHTVSTVEGQESAAEGTPATPGGENVTKTSGSESTLATAKTEPPTPRAQRGRS
jgi:hypothetical protein